MTAATRPKTPMMTTLTPMAAAAMRSSRDKSPLRINTVSAADTP